MKGDCPDCNVRLRDRFDRDSGRHVVAHVCPRCGEVFEA